MFCFHLAYVCVVLSIVSVIILDVLSFDSLVIEGVGIVLMRRRPPSSTRTDTHVPNTTLFRSTTLYEATPLTFVERLKNTGNIHEQPAGQIRSEEHTSELQSLMRISYAVFCSKK